MKDFLVFDLETQRSAQDVGGWNNIADMKMSVGVVWDSAKDDFFVYLEDQVMDLIQHLKSGPLVIGYNHIGFDYVVLSGYFQSSEQRKQELQGFINLNNLDLLQDLKDRIGKRIRLDDVARPTLQIGKSADGLLALQWYQEYLQGDSEKLQKIADYCRQDVAVTRDVFLYGKKNNVILYEDRLEGIKKVPVDWMEQEPEAEDTDPDSVQLSF